MSRVSKILISIVALALVAAALFFWFVVRPHGVLMSDVYPLPSNLVWGIPVKATVLDGVKGVWVSAEPVPSSSLNFGSYYDKKLKAAGWVPDASVAADGIDGSLWGYKKDSSVILFSYKITSHQSDSATPGLTCPCTTTYKIFTGKR